MPSLEKSERLGGAAFLGVPAFEAFVWILDNYARIELLVKLHGELPPFILDPVTGFVCMCIGLALLYASNRRQLRRISESASSQPRLVDTSGAEILSIEKPKWLLPVFVVFIFVLIATPVVAIAYSLAYKGSPPKKPSLPHPPYIAYLGTPKPNVTKRFAPAIHIEQQSIGANSPNQTMIGSPGGIQAGGDVNITSDKRIIQSITLRVYLETDTPPSKITGPSDADTSAGLQSVVALFTANKERIRFATDYLFKDRQVSETRRRLSFTYTPETPDQIVGKEISFLPSISLLAVNYKDFATTIKFTFSTNTVFHAEVNVNGVSVAIIDAHEGQPETLAGGQANLDVAEAFSRAPAIYSKVVAR